MVGRVDGLEDSFMDYESFVFVRGERACEVSGVCLQYTETFEEWFVELLFIVV